MTTGEGLLVVGAVGLVGYVLYKRSIPTAPTKNPTATGGFANFAPAFGPLGAPVTVIAGAITTPVVNGVNKIVGGTSPYGAPPGLTALPNGDYQSTSGQITTTFHKDGTTTRTASANANWVTRNISSPISKFLSL